MVLDIVRDWVPQACLAFEDYRIGAFNLSKSMILTVQKWLKGEIVSQKDSGLSAREWQELCETLGQNT